MKVTLEFQLPEEQETYELHTNASALYSAIWGYTEWLRSVCKYGNPDEFNAAACREKLYGFLNENGVAL